MSDQTAWLLIITIRQIVTLLVGMLFAYWGYQLFLVRNQDHAGELSATWGRILIKLHRAAPGTFFVMFGAILIGCVAWQGTVISNGKIHYSIGCVLLISNPTKLESDRRNDMTSHDVAQESTDMIINQRFYQNSKTQQEWFEIHGSRSRSKLSFLVDRSPV